MAVNLRGVTAVLLPGTGSDDDYVYRAFSAALHDVGAAVVTPPPQPDRLIDGYRDALENAARAEPIAVGGVSIGAAVATAWALAHPGHAVAVLAALPPWTGSPDTAPAALAARQSAHLLRRDGLGSATAQMRASSPPWLAAELTRSWVGQWPALPDAMDEAARYVAPTCGELEGLTVPMGVAAATDDPVHPVEVGIEWVSAAPRAALRTVTLDEMGADPAVLGAACVTALWEADDPARAVRVG
jgi:pimeloyl-ACP methyl ester carboxylesterase